MPEPSCTSRISQIVQTFCPKVPFLLWIERPTKIGQMVRPWECWHTHTHTETERRKDGSDSMTSTADAGGNNKTSGHHRKKVINSSCQELVFWWMRELWVEYGLHVHITLCWCWSKQTWRQFMCFPAERQNSCRDKLFLPPPYQIKGTRFTEKKLW